MQIPEIIIHQITVQHPVVDHIMMQIDGINVIGKPSFFFLFDGTSICNYFFLYFYRFSEHKRERFDYNNRMSPLGYHRERDHRDRDRDRDRDRRVDKRR